MCWWACARCLVGVCTLPGGLGDGALHVSTPVAGVRNLEQILVLFKHLRWGTKTIEYFVVMDDCLRGGWESVFQSHDHCLKEIWTVQPHRDFEVFLLQLLNEGRLSQSLLVCFILLLVGHQDVIKRPVCWLNKDTSTLKNYYALSLGGPQTLALTLGS